MEAFHGWAWDVCGVGFKVIKDRLAATRQLALGFWWDSTTLTRELEERKLLQYLDMLLNNLKSVPSSWLKWFPETAWSCPRHWLNMLQLRVFNTKKIGPCCTRSVRKHTR